MSNIPFFVRPFGIVQGRLTIPPAGQLQWFPQPSWQEEFKNAEQIGIEFIELLTEREYNSRNPFWSESGREEIRLLAQKTNRKLYSSCTDYIIDHSLLDENNNESIEHVREFLNASMDLGCEISVFPLLEKSELNVKTASALVPIIKNFAQQVAETGMVICIESLLDGENLKRFLEDVNEDNVKCVFDTGNRVIDNQDLASEINILGKWIKHVHIKDKSAAGENVLLGTGLVNFYEVFKALESINYHGPLVFETTRGTEPLETATYHMHTCNFFAHEAHHD